MQVEYTFRGSLIEQQYHEIPKSLRVLVEMIHNGGDISNETESPESFSAMLNTLYTLTQLIVIHKLKRKRKNRYLSTQQF